ncbi:DUF2326 domain-containing protein [bacterium AH-315-C08]|nr:DUF2326 domain-containing protein [bacterium AH-315-C08]
MIHGISANQSSFHPVEFTAGLNVIVAERTETSSKKDTRNGLGKTTLIQIIDFCLGGSTQRGKKLCIDPLEEWVFTIDITLSGNRIKAIRAINSPNRIVISGPTSGWRKQPVLDEDTQEKIFTLDEWKFLLGWSLFGLSRSSDEPKYKPSYRSIISYFIRQGHGAYGDPFKYLSTQKEGNKQLSISFLLGLNWEYASRWQELKDEAKRVEAIEQAIKSGAFEGAFGSIGELEAERVQLETSLNKGKEALDNFKVHPQYKNVQEEADRVTSQIHELTNQNVTERRKLARYKESIADEKVPDNIAIEKLYQEAGIVFPEMLKRTLTDAKDFHRKIVENRKVFLETEIGRLGLQLQQREESIGSLTEKRAESLSILRTHGALQEMVSLQEKYHSSLGRLERLRSRIKDSKDLTSKKREVKTAKSELQKVAEKDHEERRTIWSEAIQIFNENSQALYDTPGSLIINIADTGYKFDVEIERSGSEGVGKMKIFSFDLMLLELTSRQNGWIDFLVHDSMLYDGVDSRQIAHALEHAATVSQKIGGQYICTLNSDMIPNEDFTEGFDINKFIRLKLTDKDPSGRLLGFQFNGTVDNEDTDEDFS